MLSLFQDHLLLVYVLVLFGATILTRFRKRHRLPPGPSGLPFIGNALQIPSQEPQVAFAELGRKYGDVVYLSVFGKPMIVLNSLKACQDLLDKRSSIYSDRPQFVSFDELGWLNVPTQISYGRRFRRQRQMIQTVFNRHRKGGMNELRDQVQAKEARTLLVGLLNDPESFRNHFQRYAAASIVKITYGRSVSSVDDEFVQLAEEAARLTVQSTSSPAAAIVDIFPILRHIPIWIPLLSYRRRTASVRAKVESMINIPFNAVVREMSAPLCFTSSMLDLYGPNISTEIEEDIRAVSGALYAAAVDTTCAVLEAFMLAMVLYPQVLKKAQDEIDRVVGSERIVDESDQKHLPYIENVLKEVLRWSPPVPLALPHKLMEDDEYNGFFMPKSSTVLANVSAILGDCPDPGRFVPERYEAEDMVDPRVACFGFGRRMCPGRHFAEDGIWFIIANIIAAFDITRCRDPVSGEEIVPPVAFEAGFVRHPKPFQCVIKPRSGRHADMLSKLQV